MRGNGEMGRASITKEREDWLGEGHASHSDIGPAGVSDRRNVLLLSNQPRDLESDIRWYVCKAIPQGNHLPQTGQVDFEIIRVSRSNLAGQ